MKRVAIIGNGGGGKTTLARILGERHGLPITHVDSIQFLAGMKVRDPLETTARLNQVADQERWLIDGFGSFDVMERRFKLADKVVFVDFPLWRHYWWCTKRQFKSIWFPRTELPAGCNEATLSHTIKLYKILWRVHQQIRPRLIELFERPEMKDRVVRISNLKEWQHMGNNL